MTFKRATDPSGLSEAYTPSMIISSWHVAAATLAGATGAGEGTVDGTAAPAAGLVLGPAGLEL